MYFVLLKVWSYTNKDHELGSHVWSIVWGPFSVPALNHFKRYALNRSKLWLNHGSMAPFHSFDFCFSPSNGKGDTNSTYIDGLVQNCSNIIANALELIQSCTKPSHVDIRTKRNMHVWLNIHFMPFSISNVNNVIRIYMWCLYVINTARLWI